MPLLAVPNVSEGRDAAVLAAIGAAFAADGVTRVLDVHTDPDHHRTVFSLAGEPGSLAAAVVRGARVAVERIDLTRHSGVHPRVGALDVAPIVHLDDAARGAAVAEALVLADRLAEDLGVPVYLYDALGGGRTRAQLRRDGGALLHELAPDFGPSERHPTAGATLVTARPPLVAFNVELAPPATLADARRIAALIREGGAEGLPSVRALGVPLERSGAVQVTTNIEDHRATTPGALVEAVRRHAGVTRAELVALAPEAAFADFPADVPMPGFDPDKRLIERLLRA
ncbi:MAG: glutamate formiminotransferase / 5-formyltetrahydrofolate cyclo-ligase [Solirubrobacteraceae bacterium]|nr:glutamate formiminotransferase / 5-formyltetrahydrofolate cyclo-ligase [Solirubrobacteraceae bacterium]